MTIAAVLFVVSGRSGDVFPGAVRLLMMGGVGVEGGCTLFCRLSRLSVTGALLWLVIAISSCSSGESDSQAMIEASVCSRVSSLSLLPRFRLAQAEAI